MRFSLLIIGLVLSTVSLAPLPAFSYGGGGGASPRAMLGAENPRIIPALRVTKKTVKKAVPKKAAKTLRKQSGGGSSSSAAPAAGSEAGEAVTGTQSITLQGFAFKPAKITVKKGTTVTWTNRDSTVHTVTGGGGKGPQSDHLAQGGTSSFTFQELGTFPYACSFHPSMRATVEVVP